MIVVIIVGKIDKVHVFIFLGCGICLMVHHLNFL
jgi:hypothetical protein